MAMPRNLYTALFCLLLPLYFIRLGWKGLSNKEYFMRWGERLGLTHNKPSNDKWIRSGKSAGNGAQSNFARRGAKHIENSKSLEQMKAHALYRLYPDRSSQNLGAPDGFFDHLDMSAVWHSIKT